ncbi:MAG TPA: DUF485 domain-containing protein [Clostridia bacterium]|nr:DUF485 domain-containing protein [Clostridia bacterium]
MSHGPATEWKKDNSASFKSRLGIIMFIVYAIIYASFIFINVFNPSLVAADIGTLNVAIVYGFGLIIIAIILALIYNHLCTRAEEKMNIEDSLEEEAKGGDI